jgi:ABC-type transport system involved in multi-copper enzyme maturation permease subunit
MKLLSIAQSTFKESIRDRIFIFVTVINLIIIVSSGILAPLVLGQFEKIVKDLGLATMQLFGIVITVLIGTRLVFDETDKKTIHFILSKPISRGAFIVGKYLGLVFVTLFYVALMTVGFYLAQALLLQRIDISLLKAILFIALQLDLIVAIAFLFSTFVSPIASGIFSFLLYVIGSYMNDLVVLSQTVKSAVARILASLMVIILPNFSLLDIKREAVYRIPISPMQTGGGILYAICYIAFLILLTCAIFEKREF